MKWHIATDFFFFIGTWALEATHLGNLMKMDMGAIKGVKNTLT